MPKICERCRYLLTHPTCSASRSLDSVLTLPLLHTRFHSHHPSLQQADPLRVDSLLSRWYISVTYTSIHSMRLGLATTAQNPSAADHMIQPTLPETTNILLDLTGIRSAMRPLASKTACTRPSNKLHQMLHSHCSLETSWTTPSG